MQGEWDYGTVKIGTLRLDDVEKENLKYDTLKAENGDVNKDSNNTVGINIFFV